MNLSVYLSLFAREFRGGEGGFQDPVPRDTTEGMGPAVTPKRDQKYYLNSCLSTIYLWIIRSYIFQLFYLILLIYSSHCSKRFNLIVYKKILMFFIYLMFLYL